MERVILYSVGYNALSLAQNLFAAYNADLSAVILDRNAVVGGHYGIYAENKQCNGGCGECDVKESLCGAAFSLCGKSALPELHNCGTPCAEYLGSSFK